ncbi:hypothetical protein TCA2_4522 [Paenibacillus sp. TCA20]|uniref:hypothetical protein n=1 Tax=Paenibacillus sp. TCA20 TaxID=1499968 RepID=UPI0004D8A9C0|nr:hypothetical protein [Paenibacillus sp. TCA20]GAK42030.1 hypothetical protein TCA2_4522 [Paenibacillus sp. TCA20]
MAKLFMNVLSRIGLKNATTPTGGSSSSGITVNRDPKATQVKRVGYAVKNSSGGSDAETPKSDFAAIATAIERDSYLTQTVLKYSELIMKGGYAFKSRSDEALQYLKTRLDMMAIATQVPTDELFHGIADDIVRFHNSFVVKARAKNGVGLPPGLPATAVLPAKDPVAGYFRLPPATISITRDDQGNVTSYTQDSGSGGDTVDFQVQDMIHIPVNRPAGEAFGIPFLAPVIDDVRLLRKVEENAALLLYRHIFPLLAYTVGVAQPGYEATDEELEAIRSVIEDLPTDGAIVLPERHKVEAVSITAIDGRPYLDYFENRVFSGLGMSQVDFGRGDTANRNTADAMGGNKADRVKGWQKTIQMYIDQFIIEELLVEGGYDPMANPDFKVNFVFNEIEQEMRIKVETHEIFKFEHNVQTWDETRKNIGMDPVTDEGRLHFQMIGMQQAEHQATLDQAAAAASGSAETNNKQQPTNQNGTRSGPKSSTESLKEMYDKVIGISLKEKDQYDQIQSEFELPIETVQSLHKEMSKVFSAMEEDVIGEIQRTNTRNRFPMTSPSEALSAIHFSKDKMDQVIQKEARSVLLEGAKKAATQLKLSKAPGINLSQSLRLVSEFTQDSFDLMEETIHHVLNEKLKGVDDENKAILITRSVFESVRHRIKAIAKTTVIKTYHYGYVLALGRSGVSSVKALHEPGSCSTCYEKSQEIISLVELSSYDEMAIFYRIPPFHTNCECDLTIHDEGGEAK